MGELESGGLWEKASSLTSADLLAWLERRDHLSQYDALIFNRDVGVALFLSFGVGAHQCVDREGGICRGEQDRAACTSDLGVGPVALICGDGGPINSELRRLIERVINRAQ